MNNKGKATVLLLAIFCGIFLCSTVIAALFFKQESDKRMSVEKNLSSTMSSKKKVEAELEDAKKQLYLLQEKLKESDAKIQGLMSDLELVKTSQEPLVTENSRLKEALAVQESDRNNLLVQVKTAQGELSFLKEKLAGLEKEKADLAQKAAEVPLGKIVISPDGTAATPASILSINKDYQFVVTSLGLQDSILPEQILTVSRDNNILGELKVQRVQGNLSVADAIPPLKVDSLKEGDRVAIKK